VAPRVFRQVGLCKAGSPTTPTPSTPKPHTGAQPLDPPGPSAAAEANLRARGFDFDFATLIFERTTLEKEDRRKDYGERRVAAVGVADGFHLTVVYTDRIGPAGEVIRRIISARRSSKRERQAYRKATQR
jgi:uncharacterized DUF497 family protein